MCFYFYSNSLYRTLLYSNMTVSLCIRQGSERNDDSVSVEELDWSAESQVLIPAEHLWCDFKYRPWAKNVSPNTNDLYIWVPSFHTLQNCCVRGGNNIFKYMNYVSIFVATVWKCLFLFQRTGCPSTFGNIVYIWVTCVAYLLHVLAVVITVHFL